MTWHPTPRSPRPLRVKLTQSELASLDRLAPTWVVTEPDLGLFGAYALLAAKTLR